MKLSLAIKALVLSAFIWSCGNSDISKNRTFDIYLDYWNPTGRSPQIRFDELKTSKEIKIDFGQTFEGQTEGTSITKVVIDNFKIVDNQSINYNIEAINAYEYRSDSRQWKEDVEFTMSFNQSQDVGVMVMVLDRSKSLGDDFEKIKQYAIDFVEQTFQSHPGVQMGIVDFSTTVNALPITSDKEAIKAYISKLTPDDFTALYEAIDQGVEMLLRSSAQSRVLVTFTDGKDNNSNTAYYNLDNVLSKIRNDKNANKIRSFFIGLEGKGGIDNEAASKLSSNGWIVSIPKNTNQLKDVFDKFVKLASNVYHLTYIRNQQVVPRETPIKLKFVITTSK